MWKDKWNEKKKSNASLTEEQFWAEFNWENCPECLEKEKNVNHKLGEFSIDITNKNIT
jgi:hypothetical protein